MTPIRFKQSNVTFAENQPEYLPLPAHRDFNPPEYAVTTCWQLTWRERIKMFLSGRFYLRLLTFGQPLQPLLPTTENPLEIE